MQSSFSDKDMEKLRKRASAKGIDINKMKAASDQGKLDDFLNSSLSADTGRKLKELLSDKAATEKLLNSSEAKALLNTLINKDK